MKTNSKYKHSFLSMLVISAWIVLVFKVFYSEDSDRWFMAIPITYSITIAVGIIGGSILIFIRTIRKRKLKYSFIYNLFGTLNVLVGFIGLAWSNSKFEKPLYLLSASFAVGVFIYNDIYFKKSISKILE